MPHIQCLAPIARNDAKILILGSMPGKASLGAERYYAHPQNVFWRIMGSLISLDPALPYANKLQALMSARIALWDVLHSCIREGSLDSHIEAASQIPNDFQSFFSDHSNITHVFFNGALAEQAYRKHVLGQIPAGNIEYLRLPSTSPANAAISYARKHEAWKIISHTLESKSK